MRDVIMMLFVMMVGAMIASNMISATQESSYEEGFKDGNAANIKPLNDIEEFCDALERLDEDIYLTWVREDGARLQVCVRGKDRQMYAFSRPAVEQPEYIRVSDSKPLWYEDGTYGYKNID